MHSDTQLMVERLESLKSGLIGSLALILAFLCTSFVNQLVLAQYFPTLFTEEMDFVNLHFLLGGLIAGFSGWLFGFTYRYIIRSDQNPQLQVGAVFSFGFPQGFTAIKCSFSYVSTILSLLILPGESLLSFAC